MKRPNILFLFSDQQRYDTLGVLNPSIRTPNLDRLAAEGTVFKRAYAPTPVCLPCRASFLTGQYSATHGACHNHSALPEDYPQLLSTVLRQRGYYTHMIGKSHLSNCHDPVSKEAAPFIHNRKYYRQWHGPWYGFERADLAIGHSTEKHACGMHYGAWLEDQGVDTEKYFGHTAYEQYGTWDLPEQLHNSKWTADVTIEAIRRAVERGQPFFIWSNFQDPHNPCMVPEPWSRMYDPNKIPLFGFKPGEPDCYADKPAFYREVIEQPGPYAARPSDPAMAGAGNVSHLAWSQRQTQENAACYYGMISLMDKHIGRILDELDRLGVRENTLIVFSSDHGDLLGDHGFWWKSLVSYEESIRVPMIASLPKVIPKTFISNAFHSLLDLFPTFCSFAGVPVPSGCHGVDQRAVWEGEVDRIRSDVVIEERAFQTGWAQRILVTDNYKLVYYAGRDEGELYDMQTDPHHVHNLWSRSDMAGVREQLLRRLLSVEMLRGQPNGSPRETTKKHVL